MATRLGGEKMASVVRGGGCGLHGTLCGMLAHVGPLHHQTDHTLYANGCVLECVIESNDYDLGFGS